MVNFVLDSTTCVVKELNLLHENYDKTQLHYSVLRKVFQIVKCDKKK